MYVGIGVTGNTLKMVHPISDSQTPDWARTTNMARAIRRPKDTQIANAYSSESIQTEDPRRG